MDGQGQESQEEKPCTSSPLIHNGLFNMSSPLPPRGGSLHDRTKASPGLNTGTKASPGLVTGTKASPGFHTGTKASPGLDTGTKIRASRVIGSAQKRRLLSRMLMLSHATSTTRPIIHGSSNFAENRLIHDVTLELGEEKDKMMDESFVNGNGSGESGEVNKVGGVDDVRFNVLERSYHHRHPVTDIATISDIMNHWRDEGEEGEMEEIDDGGNGWYEKAMEIIRQDALIQEQVLAATLL